MAPLLRPTRTPTSRYASTDVCSSLMPVGAQGTIGREGRDDLPAPTAEEGAVAVTQTLDELGAVGPE